MLGLLAFRLRPDSDGGDEDLGQQRPAVGVEEAIERPAYPVVAELFDLLRRETIEVGREVGDGLVLAVHGLALDDQRTQEHAERSCVRQPAAAVGGHEPREQPVEPDARKDVVEHGKSADALGAQSQAGDGRETRSRDLPLAHLEILLSPPMGRRKTLSSSTEARGALADALRRIERVCAGTLHVRTKQCGKAGCRCRDEEAARHGPYNEWTRREDGRLVHRVLDAEHAAALRQAIVDYREVERLLARWESESTREMNEPDRPTT